LMARRAYLLPRSMSHSESSGDSSEFTSTGDAATSR
jgi:hypothetical protein